MPADTVTADTINALIKRVEQLEYQMSQLQNAANTHHREPNALFVDNEMVARAFQAILDAEGITNEPISAKELQRQFAQRDLDPNEFSHGIKEMREE